MKSKTVTIGKVVTVFFILLVLLITVLPFVFGLYAKSRISRAIDLAGLESGGVMKLASFERGWFSSRFDLLFELANGKSITVNNKMIHGPVYLGIPKSHTDFFINAFIISSLSLKNDAGQQTVRWPRIETIADLNGDLSGRIFVQDLKLDDDAKNDFGGGRYRLQTANRQLLVEYLLPKLSLYDSALLVQGLNIKTDVKFSGQDELTGQVQLSIVGGRYNGREDGESSMAFDNLRFSTSVVKTADRGDYSLMNYQFHMLANKLSWDKSVYSDMEVDFVIRNINTHISERIKDMFDGSPQPLSEHTRQSMLSKFVPLLPELIGDVEVELSKFYLGTPRGFIDAWFRVSAPNLSNTPMLDPIFLLSSLKLEGEISVGESIVRDVYAKQAMNMFARSNNLETLDSADVEAARQAANANAIAMLESLRNQRYIDLIEGQYFSSVNMQNGEIKINGQLFNPMQWVFPENQPKDLQQ